MVSTRLLATILVAGTTLIGLPAAQATTVDFVGYDNGQSSYTQGTVDVQGSFSYTSTNNPLGYADLTAFTISFPNAGSSYTFDTTFVQNGYTGNSQTYFQFDPTTDAPILNGLTVMAATDSSSGGNQFQIDYFSNQYYWSTYLPSIAPNSISGFTSDLTFTVRSSSIATPEPNGIAVFAVAIAGMAMAHGRGQRRRRPAA